MMGYFTKIAVFSMLCFIAEIGLLCADTTTNLSHKLAIINQLRDTTQTEVQELEQEYLSLLKNVNTAEDSGLVYAEVAFTYSQMGLTPPEKTIAYCKLALQYPLTETRTAQLYVSWAYTLQILYGDSLAKANKSILRSEIAKVCLNGLKQIMSHDLSQATRNLPNVIVFDCSPDDPAYESLLKENRDSLALLKEIYKQRDLVRYRNELIDELAYLIKLDSGMKGKIEQLAQSTLANKDEVKEVLSLIDKKLSIK
jgi:hypothetical protein